ncbi:MAG: geranylgeranylglyceryl/heptaprenylglyceryl phosphate synthase, partial [Planctomycetota bacterium]|nr:geranylgeranylglyceryl/heptaprenylglyceryl phosphate synthase [Planctomycetota bacterium]
RRLRSNVNLIRYNEVKGLAYSRPASVDVHRFGQILKDAGGFVYYIMVTGVTGTRSADATDVKEHVERLRTCTDLPIAVGFGVASGEQASAVGDAADAVVVGSALINAAGEERLVELVDELHAALG